jgi:hypothetical protein
VAQFKVLCRHFPGGTEENHKNLSQDRRSRGRDLNSGPPEYEAGVLNTWPRRSVSETRNARVLMGNCHVFIYLSLFNCGLFNDAVSGSTVSLCSVEGNIKR